MKKTLKSKSKTPVSKASSIHKPKKKSKEKKTPGSPLKRMFIETPKKRKLGLEKLETPLWIRIVLFLKTKEQRETLLSLEGTCRILFMRVNGQNEKIGKTQSCYEVFFFKYLFHACGIKPENESFFLAKMNNHYRHWKFLFCGFVLHSGKCLFSPINHHLKDPKLYLKNAHRQQNIYDFDLESKWNITSLCLKKAALAFESDGRLEDAAAAYEDLISLSDKFLKGVKTYTGRYKILQTKAVAIDNATVLYKRLHEQVHKENEIHEIYKWHYESTLGLAIKMYMELMDLKSPFEELYRIKIGLIMVKLATYFQKEGPIRHTIELYKKARKQFKQSCLNLELVDVLLQIRLAELHCLTGNYVEAIEITDKILCDHFEDCNNQWKCRIILKSILAHVFNIFQDQKLQIWDNYQYALTEDIPNIVEDYSELLPIIFKRSIEYDFIDSACACSAHLQLEEFDHLVQQFSTAWNLTPWEQSMLNHWKKYLHHASIRFQSSKTSSG